MKVTLLTERRYTDPPPDSPYIRNILTEDGMVMDALVRRGVEVERVSWDNPEFDWSRGGHLLFRSTWDYFDRFGEFSRWLEDTKDLAPMINPYPVIRWNLDKHYLKELSEAGIAVPPTRFMEQGDPTPLRELVQETGWEELILKPVVSGAARHTYRFRPGEEAQYDEIYRKLIGQEALMLQEFQQRVLTGGEVAFMLIDGTYTHAVLKRAKPGDFRVQDDFGGTVERYPATAAEIAFAERVVEKSGASPVYARVDAVWDNHGELAVSELELIEPELWFRFHPPASEHLADTIVRRCFRGEKEH